MWKLLKTEPYVRKTDGEPSLLGTWRRACAACGKLFEERGSAKAPPQYARCKPCRKPQTAVSRAGRLRARIKGAERVLRGDFTDLELSWTACRREGLQRQARRQLQRWRELADKIESSPEHAAEVQQAEQQRAESRAALRAEWIANGGLTGKQMAQYRRLVAGQFTAAELACTPRFRVGLVTQARNALRRAGAK